MNNIALTHHLKSNAHTRKVFGGVYPIDMLRKIKFNKAVRYYIINTEPTGSEGRHWFVVGASKRTLEVFDSTAKLALRNRQLLDFLAKHFVKVRFNACQYQSVKTKVCGQWCCLYIHHRALKRPLRAFVDKFSKYKFYENDKKVVDMFNSVFAAATA